MLYENLGINEQGHLTIGGLDAVDLAKEFGAPLYVLDEDKVRANCRTYVQALADYIRIIQEEYQKRSGRGEEDPLRAAMEKYRKSGNGGKQA